VSLAFGASRIGDLFEKLGKTKRCVHAGNSWVRSGSPILNRRPGHQSREPNGPVDWTRSVTLGFVQWMENEGNQGRGYAPTSVNRTLATLRRAARWIQNRRPFMAGDPFERVSDLVVTVPAAKGLSALQRRRVLAAADKLCALQAQKNQQPRRKRALLVVLLETGMRISETLRLTLDQYDGKYFRNVKRKGKRRDDVYVSPEARTALADYFEHERRSDGQIIFMN